MTGRRGWTLVEMLVAMAIVAALMSMAVPIFRTVNAQSQTTQNLANMGLTMKDFFIWSGQHNGRMVNKGLPRKDNPFGYLTQNTEWPETLFAAFGEASAHWQSTYSDPQSYLNGTMTMAEARRRDPTWEFRIPTDYIYSWTMLTSPQSWQYPGLMLPDLFAFFEYFAYMQHSDIASPTTKGVLWHNHVELGPGRQRLIAFADGAVSQRDMLSARPSAAVPTSKDSMKRFGPVAATLNGFLGQDF